MNKILVSTIYNSYAVIATANKFSVNIIILLTDKNPDDTMSKNIKLIEDSLGSVLCIKKISTDIYDIVNIAKQIVKILDNIPNQDEIYIDITSGRKPKSLALLFASYARSKHIKKIVYVTEDTKEIITLPKMNYAISSTQLNCLDVINKKTNVTTIQITQKLGLTKAIIYRNVRDLLEMDAIEKKGEELELTDFGEILLL